ncbi:plasmid partitioning protein RepB [Acidisoma cellulosilytica]|uniref:Plasmid partitioning protein RepB n=1 Tax=Acidisoma cellulosilyticum TaxID=2802395 RepID=A0A963Z597_9PROT|nr:plasmid partitioning protein RepB [Acidisoma cellulosilyticum]MCB8882701.1 plasmid partitioning protein RepB [Acidisoma cellulosilyticum]
MADRDRIKDKTEPGIEAAMGSTDRISDLDPALIDHSFIEDRMEPTDANYRRLRESIAAQGQTSPILIRPHPAEPGRYQAAFGHRRLRAAAELGRPVRCIVRPLTDRDLVIAQGQENSARADLSFIEQGRFAIALQDRGYSRETIMQALSLDKASLSRLVRVTDRLPTDIVEAIGPAPAIGRNRWMALSLAFRKYAADRPVDPLLEDASFIYAPSDQRFDLLYRHLTRPAILAKRKPSPSRRYRNSAGQTIATATQTETTTTVTIDRTVTRAFGEFLLGRLDALYAEYMAGHPAEPHKPPVLWHSIER